MDMVSSGWFTDGHGIFWMVHRWTWYLLDGSQMDMVSSGWFTSYMSICKRHLTDHTK
jgi:hypothetical protein